MFPYLSLRADLGLKRTNLRERGPVGKGQMLILRVGRCGAPILTVFLGVSVRFILIFGRAIWGHPDHDSPFSSKKESGVILTMTHLHSLRRKSGKDSACTLVILLPAKKRDWTLDQRK